MTETSDTAISHIAKGGAYAEPLDRATPADAQRPDAVQAAPDSSAAELAEKVAVLRQQVNPAVPEAVEVPGTVEQTTELEPARCCHDDEPHLSVSIVLSDQDEKSDKPSGIEISVHASGGKGTAAAVLAAEAYQEVSARLSQETTTGDSAGS